MKNRISILLFGLGLVAAYALGNPMLGVIAVAGLFFVQTKNVKGLAMLTLVPAIITVTNPNTGIMEEAPPMTRAEKALFDYLRAKSNLVTFDAIQSGAISFDPISYVVRAAVTGLSGTQQIVGPNTLFSKGVTNLPNGATLPQYYNFCFDRVAVRYCDVATATLAPNLTSAYSTVSSSMDPALRNGNLIVKSNRNNIIETPVIDFVSQAAVTGGGSREYDGGILEKPRFFLEQLQIEVFLDLAGTVPSVSGHTYLVEVVFSGVQARLKY